MTKKTMNSAAKEKFLARLGGEIGFDVPGEKRHMVLANIQVFRQEDDGKQEPVPEAKASLIANLPSLELAKDYIERLADVPSKGQKKRK